MTGGRVAPVQHVNGRPPSADQGAICAQVDPDMWFPEKGGDVQKPKRLCRQCPLQAACLEWSLTAREPFGIWGGLTAIERSALLRERGLEGF